jgi:hypothetical protein
LTDFEPEMLETPKQLAERVGLSPRQVRRLIDLGQLEHVRIGCRDFIPRSGWPRFLNEAVGKKPWQDEIRGRNSAGSPSAAAFTSPGPNEAGVASAARARQIAKELKDSSLTGCTPEITEMGRVIPLKSS